MSLRSRFAVLASLSALLIALWLVLSSMLAVATDASGRAAAPTSQTSAAALPLDSPIVINELMPLVQQGKFQWVELFNNSASLFLPLVSGAETEGEQAASGYARNAAGATVGNLSGWQISAGSGAIYTFPDGLPTLPPQTFVLVYFDGLGETANEYDLSDGVITLHTPSGMVNSFGPVDQISLFSSAVHTTTTLVDFVAYGDFPNGGAALAVEAGQWPPDTFTGPTTQSPGGDVLVTGGSLGRYPLTKSGGAEEWTIYKPGESTPGAANRAPAPYFRTPFDGAITFAGEVAFGWSHVPDAASYQFQIAEEATFAAPTLNVAISDTVYTAVLTTTLELSRTYYFRAQSLQNDDSQSDWSVVNSVTVIPMPVEPSAVAASRVLNVTPQLQHKDTRMMCLDGDPEFGIHRWDSAHEADGDLVVGNGAPRRGNPHGDWYCTRASISMIADFYGSKLSQDRISYYAYGGGAPEGDLGHGIGLWPNQGCTQGGGKNVMWWAMNNGAGVCARGKPTFAQVKAWIDAGRPALFVENNDAHSVVLAGYWEFDLWLFSWQFAYRIDPWTNSAGWISYNSWNVSEYHVPPAGVAPRSDEASLSSDGDGDGIVDFDELFRFPTLFNNPDTDRDCVRDKQDVRSYVFDNLGNYSKRNPDWDGDGLRKEVDRDNDGDFWIDGDEDKNWNGKTVDAFGRRDGVDTSNFRWWEFGPGPCSPTPTRTPTP
ncbi:MAG: hypothetical protein HY328_17465, partial [Chloroflexi bacterium]|nr:hypothetical protein [Chloroflexota bacterium]